MKSLEPLKHHFAVQNFDPPKTVRIETLDGVFYMIEDAAQTSRCEIKTKGNDEVKTFQQWRNESGTLIGNVLVHNIAFIS